MFDTVLAKAAEVVLALTGALWVLGLVLRGLRWLVEFLFGVDDSLKGRF